jgi:hypothetical protein
LFTTGRSIMKFGSIPIEKQPASPNDAPPDTPISVSS